MKTELKREGPKEAIKEDKGKEAMGDQVQAGGQAMLAEEEDICQDWIFGI